jgi:beta-lactamase regulating signal transducer with metallopeptidase domain
MMSDFLNESSWLQSALPMLTDAALKGAILIGIAAAAAYLLRKRSAASRHAVWTAAVIGHLAIPALIFLLPGWTLPVLPTPSWMPVASARGSSSETSTSPVVQSGVASELKSSGAEKAGATKTPSPAIETKRGSPSSGLGAIGDKGSPARRGSASATTGAVKSMSTIQIVTALWLLGAVFVLLRLAIGTWRVGQLAREGTRVEDGVWLSLTQRLANTLGVTRPLILLRGERLAVPVTWGVIYPAVLLPQDADQWTEERRRFVLVHEMAHVKRFDALTQLLAQLSLAIFWFDPLVWVAAHRMRVEREHACDDYVLRDGTTPSLYASELLEMVRSISTRKHDRAAPAFAALAMARRSEFEGRMLSILDPKLDRKTLNKRGTLMTGIIVALLTIPLAALRPFYQAPAQAATLPQSGKPATVVAPAAPAISPDEFPASFKVSLTGATQATQSTPAAPARKTLHWKWSCDQYPVGTTLHGTSTHIDAHDDANSQSMQYLVSDSSGCTEAAIIGKAVFSSDETRIEQLSPGGFARFRQRTSVFDRAVSMTPAGGGSFNYTALSNGRTVRFDATMQSWLAGVIPEVLREAAVNAPERVARIRSQSGVAGVLRMISGIHTISSRGAHYAALLEAGPLAAADAEKVAIQAPKDLAGSSSDLTMVIEKLPRSAMQSAGARRALADALPRIASSGDRANALQLLAPSADPELLMLLAKTAEGLPSSGDKANFLITTAAEYLSGPSESLHDAYFRAVATISSSGDMANVLITAMPFGHANSDIPLRVIDASKGLISSGDAANVLITLVRQRLLQSDSHRATMAAIERTLTMASSGDRANVLISIADNNLLDTRELKDAFTKAAVALPSDGDRANVLTAAARR